MENNTMNSDMNRISVKDYIENLELLELDYTPYEKKIEIVDVIMSQVISDDDVPVIDSCLLHRISTEIFIEYTTNIDMSIVDQYGLSGYDTLCLSDMLDVLRNTSEFKRFQEILDMKISDFNMKYNNVNMTLINLKRDIQKYLTNTSQEVNDYIKNIDVRSISQQIINIVKKSQVRS